MRSPLKPYVRFDGTGRIVSSSLIYRRTKPLDGNWKLLDIKKDITTYEQFFLCDGNVKADRCSPGEPLNAYTKVEIINEESTGVIIYYDKACTLPLLGGNYWYLHTNLYVFQIDDNGVVIDTNNCD
jgi:hypothetical protein